MPFSVDTDVLEQGVDATLARLCGGNIDDTWWQNLLNHIGHQVVAPDFLRMPALQEWLADEQVQRDFKARARTNDAGNMTSVARTLSDQDIEDLGHYTASLY